MKNYLKIITLVLVLTCKGPAFGQNPDFERLMERVQADFSKLSIPRLQLAYTATLAGVQEIEELEKQEQFFTTLLREFESVDQSLLSKYQLLDFQIMSYESKLNLERINLEKQWEPVALDESKSIFTVPDGKEWYVYLLKRWVDADVDPEQLFVIGIAETANAKSNMIMLQQSSGMNPTDFKKYLQSERFYIHEVDEVQKRFELMREKVSGMAADFFPYTDQIARVKIAKGTNANLAQVPAYYNNGTFYYNYFDEPFNERQISWFYIHEAVPGHHYQSNLNNILKRTEIQNEFWYPGFSEGWGAYVEYLGKELGFYESIYDEYGKWEWDLIRSVRVMLDIGINYFGWNDEEAMKHWRMHIEDQDDIGTREIKRMKRWPAQVITYKYGAYVFLKLLEEAKNQPDFSYKEFHLRMLKHGDIPLSMIK